MHIRLDINARDAIAQPPSPGGVDWVKPSTLRGGRVGEVCGYGYDFGIRHAF
ncbi:hypothetical protein [Variovorax sp. GT1P44]|uniref:hypothetical protein n=1 Tax=Variovorax sp. GT1P44 TaxID=3443742 RepID=UPI003F46EC2C